MPEYLAKSPLRILTVLGARPQFIKAAPVRKCLLEAGHHEFLVHTGQHYDHNMSKIFFEEMEIRPSDVNLEVGSATHGKQTAEMLIRLEEIMQERHYDCVLVYGDTNSTLAGALAACKLRRPIAHIEAGLRSYNRAMPEEHNRVITDHCADFLFCPTSTAVNNLLREGITENVFLVGDTMFDAVQQFRKIAEKRSSILSDLNLRPKTYLLATIHRPGNTDELGNLRNILDALFGIGETVVFPVHPRTREKIKELNFSPNSNIKMIEPVGYLDLLALQENAKMVVTDSGGMQKEAYFLGVPCVTLRSETEWIETVEAGWNRLVGSDPDKILSAVRKNDWPSNASPTLFGDGHAAQKIVSTLTEILS